MERNDRRWMPAIESPLDAGRSGNVIGPPPSPDDLEANLLTLFERAGSARDRVVAWFDQRLNLWRCAWCDRPLLSERCDCGEN